MENSDTIAKSSFKNYIRGKGFDVDAEWKDAGHSEKCPADVYAKKDGKEYFFEIKAATLYDGKKEKRTQIFGAATLSEWMAALFGDFKDRYFFVLAIQDGKNEKDKKNKQGDYSFYFIKPTDFLKYSIVPPFKIDFNIKVSENNGFAQLNRKKTSIVATSDVIKKLNEKWNELSQNHSNETQQKCSPDPAWKTDIDEIL